MLGPNINAPMDPQAVASATRAVARAQEVVKDAGPKETALIAALTARNSSDPDADRTKRNRAYADAMAEVAVRFPQDTTIQAIYADALMNLSPWDYW